MAVQGDIQETREAHLVFLGRKRHLSLRAYGMSIRQLPDLVCTGQVGGLRRDPGAGNDG